jgi:hypothetical protein
MNSGLLVRFGLWRPVFSRFAAFFVWVFYGMELVLLLFYSFGLILHVIVLIAIFLKSFGLRARYPSIPAGVSLFLLVSLQFQATQTFF